MNGKVSAFQHPWKPCWRIPEDILLPRIQTPPSWAPRVKSAGLAETKLHRSNRSWGRVLASERKRRSERPSGAQRPQDLCQRRHGCSAPHVQPLLDTRDGVVDAEVWEGVSQWGMCRVLLSQDSEGQQAKEQPQKWKKGCSRLQREKFPLLPTDPPVRHGENGRLSLPGAALQGCEAGTCPRILSLGGPRRTWTDTPTRSGGCPQVQSAPGSPRPCPLEPLPFAGDFPWLSGCPDCPLVSTSSPRPRKRPRTRPRPSLPLSAYSQPSPPGPD